MNSTPSRSFSEYRLYSENYVEPAPPAQDARDAAARRDTGMQGGLLGRGSREH